MTPKISVMFCVSISDFRDIVVGLITNTFIISSLCPVVVSRIRSKIIIISRTLTENGFYFVDYAQKSYLVGNCNYLFGSMD